MLAPHKFKARQEKKSASVWQAIYARSRVCWTALEKNKGPVGYW